MATRFMDRVLSFMGFEEQTEWEEDQPRQQVDRPALEEVTGSKRKGQLISLGRQTQMRVMVLAPRSYDAVEEVANHLKNGRAVITCLDAIDRELARRIVDFMSGTTFAVDGKIQRIAEGIFLFTPANIEIEVDPTIDLREKKMAWVTGSVSYESSGATKEARK